MFEYCNTLIAVICDDPRNGLILLVLYLFPHIVSRLANFSTPLFHCDLSVSFVSCLGIRLCFNLGKFLVNVIQVQHEWSNKDKYDKIQNNLNLTLLLMSNFVNLVSLTIIVHWCYCLHSLKFISRKFPIQNTPTRLVLAILMSIKAR